jgi:hypothetical protein
MSPPTRDVILLDEDLFLVIARLASVALASADASPVLVRVPLSSCTPPWREAEGSCIPGA